MTVTVVGPAFAAGDGSGAGGAGLTETLVNLYHAALPADQRDDRFDGWSPSADLVGAVATIDGRPAAWLGGGSSRDRVQLDAIVDPTAIGAVSGADLETRAADLIATMHEALRHGLDGPDGEDAPGDGGPIDTVELWGRPARPWHGRAAALIGMHELRGLYQMRCALPVAEEPVPSRPFRPGLDEEALLRVNNRAFASHPDQGGMTLDDLASASAEPWFRPEAIRLYDDPDGGQHLAGFCWTKIHPPLGPGEPALGEIYAIGVDPDHHGKGLGRPMTAAGLDWLAGEGLTTGMLYVEADNIPAIRTYRRLGFTEHRNDRAWHRSLR